MGHNASMTQLVPWPTLLAHLAALLLLLPACGIDSEPGGGGGGGEPEEVSADFELVELVTVDPLESPEGVEKVEGEGPKVIALLNRLYDIAFLDPQLWEEGEHPEMAELFTEKGQTRLVSNQDLDALALEDLAPQLERVVPTKQEVTKLTFFVGDNLTTPIGLATVVFEATGTPADDDLEPVTIAHSAQYWVTYDDGYKISAFYAVLGVDARSAVEEDA